MGKECIKIYFMQKRTKEVFLLFFFFIFLSCKTIFDGVNVSLKEDIIPLSLSSEKNDNWVILNNISIEGRKIRGLIDTGSNLTMIDSTFFKEIIPMKYINFYDFNNNKSKREVVKIKKLKIGKNIVIKNINAVKINLKKYKEKVNIIIGNNILKKMVWFIDFKTSEVRVGKTVKDFKSINEYKKIKFNFSSNLIKLDVKHNQYYKKIIFDTGSKSQINLPIRDTIYFNKSMLLKTNSYNNYSGNKYKILKIELREIDLANNVKFNDVLATFGVGFSRILGVDLLQESKIIIDYMNNNLYIFQYQNSVQGK